MKTIIGLLCIVWTGAHVAGQTSVRPGDTVESGDVVADPMWRTSKRCGVNCLYLLIRSTGADIEYEEVLAKTKMSPVGTSLADLSESAERLGFEGRVGKGSVADLRSARLPVLVHLDQETGDANVPGHYVLVTSIDDKGNIGVFDGSSVLHKQFTERTFRRAWSGFVLELEHSGLGFAKGMTTVGAFALGLWIYWRRRRLLARAT